MSIEARKELAQALVKASKLREESYDKERMLYRVSNSQAAEQVSPEWAEIISCLLTAGYCEMWDWCEKQGVKYDDSQA